MSASYGFVVHRDPVQPQRWRAHNIDMGWFAYGPDLASALESAASRIRDEERVRSLVDERSQEV